MEKNTARACFIYGTLVTLVLFLVLTLWTLSAVRARTPSVELERNPQIVQGKKIWQHYACVDCHTILGNGAYYGPDLTKTYKSRGEPWLRKWLAEPVSVDAASIMPNLQIHPEEIPKLIAFLKWVNEIDTNGWPPRPSRKVEVKPSAEMGAELFSERGCSGCHTLKGQGGAFGPDLTGEGSRRDKSWLNVWLKDPVAVKPGTAMPRPDLTDQEREALAEYLVSQK